MITIFIAGIAVGIVFCFVVLGIVSLFGGGVILPW